MHRSHTILSIAAAVWLCSHLGSGVARGEFVLSAVATSSTAVAPGAQVSFAVVVTGLDALAAGNSIFSFSLNVGASSGGLTGAGTDFSRFAFFLDSGLAGGLAFDDDLADDGHVEFEIAHIPTGPDLTLGQMSVVAPSTVGLYNVAFQIDPLDPFGAGTFLLIEDGSSFGLVAPGDIDLSVAGSDFTVALSTAVPEPSTLALLLTGGLTLFAVRWSRRRRPAVSHSPSFPSSCVGTPRAKHRFASVRLALLAGNNEPLCLARRGSLAPTVTRAINAATANRSASG